MAIQYAPESAHAKEMVKWEAQNSLMGMGLRPYVKRDFPAVLYKASRAAHNGDFEFDTVTVDEREAPNYYSRGYHPDPLTAIDGLKAQELDFAKLAAERAHEVKHKLSRKAAAEVASVEADHFGHLPAIPETPIKRRGRPKKVVTD